MKTRICSSWVLGLVLLVLPLTGCLQESSLSSQGTVAAAAELPTPPETPVAETSADTDFEEALAQADEQSISNAPAKKVSAEIEVPANLKPSPATAEIIKLANAGVEENVMLSFVTNSLGTFNLRAEEIIYLNDIGVPSGVVTAMIQRDHLLQASSNLTVTPSEAEPSVMNPPAYPPDAIPDQPVSMTEPAAPVFDSGPAYASDNYAVPADTEPSPVDYTDYYDALAPYGSWVDIEGYGRCWQPTVVVVNNGWCPYFNCGRWVYTDCGWYWMSDYSWGWAPFHYGRWFQHATLGWCWRPDRVWGPSWVCWRRDGDFCGWAPLPPCARFGAGIGLTFRGHPARHDFSFGLGADHFRFVRTSHFLDRDLARNVLPRDHAARIFDHTIASTGIDSHNHRVTNNGIPRELVASAIHANIVPATLHNVTPTAGVGIRERFERNGRTLAVFRPELQQRTPARTPTVTRENQAPSNNRGIGSRSQDLSSFAHVQPQAPQAAPPQTALSARAEAPVRTGQPLILKGSDHPRETAMTAGAVRTPRPTSNLPASPNPQNTRRTVPLSSLVVIGQNRDSRVASTQPDNRPSWNSHNRASPSSNREIRHSIAQNPVGEGDTRYDIRQPQVPAQATWWSQPHQPRTPDQEQFRHNREMPARGGGNWNASVEQPRHNPMPVHVPEYTRQPQYAPVESHQSHSVPMESHQSHSPQVETHQSPSVESHPAQSAPAPSSSSSSSSHDSSSHSSGHGR
jgi:hypothetical protein